MPYPQTVAMVTPTNDGINITMNSTEASTPAERQKSLFAIFLCIFLTLAILLNFLLNPLMLITLRRVTSIQPTTKILMASLTLADIVSTIVRIFDVVQLFAERWLLGDLSCTVHGVMIFTSGGMSILSLLLLTLDRYIAILHPLKYFILVTEFRTKIMVCSSWIFTSICYICVFGIVDPKKHIVKQDGQTQLCLWGPSFWRDYYITGMISLILAVIFILYLHISLIARKQARRIAGANQVGNGQHAQRINTRSITTIIIITGVLVITWLPTAVLVAMARSLNVSLQNNAFNRILLASSTDVLQLSNSWLNALIYYLRNTDLRRALKGLLAEWQQRLFQRSHPQQSSLD